MQNKSAKRYVVLVIFLFIAAFLLFIQSWRPVSQEVFEQSSKAVSVITDDSSNRQPPKKKKRNSIQPYDRAQANSIASTTFVDDTRSIAGKVMDQQGKELPDIQIIALPRKFLSNKARRNAAAHEKKTLSDAFGQYRFDSLTSGEYQIQALESLEYASKRIYVLVGVEDADLVLPDWQEHWVYGEVVDYRGSPLRGVQVVPNGLISESVYTDRKGTYDIFIARKGNLRYPDQLQFSLPGYLTRKIRLPKVDLGADELTLRKVQLGNTYTPGFVKGIVHADNVPVANANVYLRSHDSKSDYRTVTDDYGTFEIREMVSGRYKVLVVAGKQYQDYQGSGLRVNALGTDLTIELEPLQFGKLSGQMVDPEGNPVPEFTLWISSNSAHGRGARSITGNKQGYFSIQQIPYGDQNIRTHTSPRLRISGIRITDKAKKPVQLVLDLGTYSINSQVVDTTGQPLSGTAITMSWEQKKGRISYSSSRNTVADHNGRFRFSHLGAGVHTLRFRAPGYKRRYRLNYNVVSKDMRVVRLPELTR